MVCFTDRNIDYYYIYLYTNLVSRLLCGVGYSSLYIHNLCPLIQSFILNCVTGSHDLKRSLNAAPKSDILGLNVSLSLFKGLLFMDDKVLGWTPLANAWLADRPPHQMNVSSF